MNAPFITTSIIFYFYIYSCFSQYSPITTLGSSAICPGTQVDVPINVVNFNNITSISLRLEYNPKKLIYDTFINPNPLLSGIIANDNYISDSLRKIIIVWSDVNPKTITSGGKLLDLLFAYSIITDSVRFNNTANGGSDCEYTDAYGTPLIDVPTSDYYHGALITNLGPDPAGQISGMTNVCNGFTGVVYSTNPIPNATGYIWSVPPGAIITNGINTNVIMVDYSETASSGNIIVYGTNYCGNGPPSPPLWINVNPVPLTPIITQQGQILISNFPQGNQWYDQNGLIPGANDQQYTPLQNGDYFVIVTNNGCSSAPSNIINYIYTNCNYLKVKLTVTPNPFIEDISLQLFFPDFNDLLEIELINEFGIMVYSNEFNCPDQKLIHISTSDFPKGMYFLRLKFKTIQLIRKLIKS